MHPLRRDPKGEQAPLEGELLSARPGPPMPGLGARLIGLVRVFWLISLGVTGWLLWLLLGEPPRGVGDVLLALILSVPLVVLTLVVLGLGHLSRLLSGASSRLMAQVQARARGEDARHVALELHETLTELRDHAEGLALIGFMLTPGFLALFGLSVLATLVMLPVAFFTLLFALF